MSKYEQDLYSHLPQLEELRRQGKRFDLQGIEQSWEDRVCDQVDLEQSCTVDISELSELEVRQLKEIE